MSLNLPSYFLRMVFLVDRYNGYFLSMAYLKQAWANYLIDSSVLYIANATPPSPLNSNTLWTYFSPPTGVNDNSKVPAPFAKISVQAY